MVRVVLPNINPIALFECYNTVGSQRDSNRKRPEAVVHEAYYHHRRGTGRACHANLALVPRLQAAGWEVHYVGTENGIERRLVEQTPGVQYHAVASGKLRRYFDLKNFTDPFRVIKGAAQAAALVHKLRPDVVFSKGGFVSVPVVYGAHLNRVPW